jgi:hypothetical protein
MTDSIKSQGGIYQSSFVMSQFKLSIFMYNIHCLKNSIEKVIKKINKK